MTTLLYEAPEAVSTLDTTRHGVIDASAGTGKTYTLQHLLVQILLDDREVRLDEVLLVTFTVAATSDLKRKIRETLEGLVRGHERAVRRGLEWAKVVDGEVVDASQEVEAARDEESMWLLDGAAIDHLRQALRNFDRAAIYTIHGFCQRILVEHAFVNQRLFEQEHVSEEDVITQAFRQMLREDIRPGTEAQEWLEAYLGSGHDIASLEESLGNYLTCNGEYRPRVDVDFQEFDRFVEELASVLQGLDVEAWIEETIPIAQATEGVTATQAKSVGSRIERLQNNLLPNLQEGRPVANLVALAGIKGSKLKYLQKEKSQLLLGQLGHFGALLDRIDDYYFDVNLMVVQSLGDLLKERVERLKEEEGYFTFNDMVKVVRDRLMDEGEDGALIRHLREEYRYGLIDEFQDTDEAQWDIFRRIFVDSDDEERHFLYLIGDPKQAIYGFRGGNVYTYLKAREALQERGAVEAALGHNFRSTSEVMAATNAIFEKGASPGVNLGEGIEYREGGVRAGKEWLHLYDGDGEVAPGLVAMDLKTESEKIGVDAIRDAMVEHYADEIEVVVKGEEVLSYRPEEGADEERVGASEIYVLARARRELDAMADALRARGVPFAFLKLRGLFQSDEAEDIYDLLVAIDDPYDRSKRARAWMTPFFDLEIRDLQGAADGDGESRLLRRLLSWRQLAEHVDFAQLFGRILEESGLIRRRLLLEEGERELTNYFHLFELLAQEGAGQIQSMERLAARLRAFIDGKEAPEADEADQQRLETDEAAVQLLTIHGSKGLQRGLVFVVPKFSKLTDKGKPYRYHELGQGGEVARVEWHDSRKNMGDEAEAQYFKEAAAEEMRLAYVAMTRAALRTYIPWTGKAGTVKDKIDGAPFAEVVERVGAVLEERPELDIEVREAPLEVERQRMGVEEAKNRLDVDKGGVALPVVEAVGDDEARDEIWQELMMRRWEVTSYSKLKSRGSTARVVDEKGDDDTDIGQLDLPGGMGTGNFLHLALEELDWNLVERYERPQWFEDQQVDRFMRRQARRFGSYDDAAIRRAKAIVYDALKTPVDVGSQGATMASIFGADPRSVQRELEFLFPVPERREDGLIQRTFWRGTEVHAGFVTGIVDLLFRYEGKVYFADWKSDIAADYSAQGLERMVEQRYGTQAMLYTAAISRMLGIDDEEQYEARYGGHFYFFVRGMSPEREGEGIYNGRVGWEELRAYEERLMGIVDESKQQAS